MTGAAEGAEEAAGTTREDLVDADFVDRSAGASAWTAGLDSSSSSSGVAGLVELLLRSRMACAVLMSSMFLYCRYEGGGGGGGGVELYGWKAVGWGCCFWSSRQYGRKMLSFLTGGLGVLSGGGVSLVWAAGGRGWVGSWGGTAAAAAAAAARNPYRLRCAARRCAVGGGGADEVSGGGGRKEWDGGGGGGAPCSVLTRAWLPWPGREASRCGDSGALKLRPTESVSLRGK